MKKYMMNVAVLIWALLALMFTGCMRPFPKPMLEEIKPNETAYLIDLEGGGKQAKFESVEFLEQSKVAAKRVEIPQRWLQTGRAPNLGKWIPEQMLIKVDRTPVARRWTGEANTGTSKSSQLLEAESKDSVGVSSGFAITAYIKEEDTSKFLYRYPNGDLASIIDNQVFNDCQAAYSKIAAKYEVRELREKKEEINDAIRSDVIASYAEEGITIKPSLGLIGGLMYDNPAIQTAIDDVFIAQTLEAKADAVLVAQQKTNAKDLSIEENDAAKRKVKADAEAYEITKKAEAIAQGGEHYLELLRLEVAKDGIAAWDGKWPTTYAGGSGTLNHLLMGIGGTTAPAVEK